MQKLYTCFRLHFSTNPAVFQYGPLFPDKTRRAGRRIGRPQPSHTGNSPRRRVDAPARAPKRLSAARGKTHLARPHKPRAVWSEFFDGRQEGLHGRGARPSAPICERPSSACLRRPSLLPPTRVRPVKNVPLCVFLDRLFLCACNNAPKDRTCRFRTAHAYRAAAAAGPYGPAAAAARQTLGHPGAQTYEFAKALCRI